MRIFDVPFLLCHLFVQGSFVLDRAVIMPDQSESLVKRAFRTRLKADTSLGVADLMAPFQSWFEHNQCRDIVKLLACPLDMDWKSVPQQKWLVKNKDLFSSLLAVAPNTMITSRKLKDALARLNDEKTINFSRKENSDLWDWVDSKVRIGCAQLRELKTSTTSWDRCMKRSTQTEKDVLKEMMNQIELGKSDSQDALESQEQDEENNKTLPRGEKNSDEQQIVPFVDGAGGDDDEKKKDSSSRAAAVVFTPPGHAKTRALQTPGNSSGSSMLATSSPANVFAGILEGKKVKKNQIKKPAVGKGRLPTSSSIEATPEKQKISSTRRKLEPLLDEEATSAEEIVQEKNDSKRKGVPLIILPAGKRIIQSKKHGTGEGSRDEESIETSQEGPSSQQCFLSSVIDAALDAEDSEHHAKETKHEMKKDQQHRKRNDQHHKETRKRNDAKEAKTEHALTEVGLAAVSCYSFLRCQGSVVK